MLYYTVPFVRISRGSVHKHEYVHLFYHDHQRFLTITATTWVSMSKEQDISS